MPRSALLALLLAVLAGGAAWILLGPDSSPESLLAEASEVDEPQDEDRAEAETTDVAASTAEEEVLDRVSVEESPEVAVAPVTKYLPHFDGEVSLSIKVIDDESGEAIPEASVYIIERDSIDEGELERAFTSGESTLHQLAVKYGKAYLSNQDGIVVVPPVSEFPFLFANKDNSFGMAWRLEAGDTETEIRIRPERWMRVSVVDASGSPAPFAPVSLRMTSDDYSFDMMTRSSDENGEVELRNLGPYIDSVEENGMGSIYVAIGIPMLAEDISEQNQVKIDDERLASHEAVLTLPPTGEVQVAVLRPDGQKFKGEGSVVLYSDENRSMGRGNSNGVELVDGIAHFKHVGLGVKIQAVLMIPGGASNDTHNFEGPTLASQMVEVEMLREERVFVVGTLVDDEDVPRANTDIRLRYRMNAGWNRRNNSSSTETDENGRFSFELPLLSEDEDDKRQHSLTVSIEQESGPDHEALFELPAKMYVGEHDLGRVKLDVPPLAVSGVVIDESGQALENARLSISKINASDDEHMRAYSRHFGDLGIQGRSGNEGKFELHHKLPSADEFVLHASLSGYQAAEVSMLPGQTDLRVVLSKASFVAGEVLLDADFPTGQLNLQTELEDGNSSWTGLSRADEDGRWTFSAQIEAHKTYSIVITSDSGTELYREAGIVAGNGETVRPPSMQPLDLRGKVKLIKIQAYSTSGDALPVEVSVSNGNHRRNQSGGKDGLTLISTEPIESMRVTSAGYASKTLENVQSDQSVILEPAVEVFLEIPTEFVEYRGLNLTVSLRPVSSNDSGVRYGSTQGSCVFDASGRGNILCDGPGTYRVSYRLTNREGSSRRSSSFTSGEIQVSAAGQVIRLEPPRDRFDRIADSLLDND